jgi:hypothetical protein
MSLQASRAKLSDGFKKLIIAWDTVRRTWDDPASRDFERKFLTLMEPKVRSALAAMEKMGETVGRVKRDCGDNL